MARMTLVELMARIEDILPDAMFDEGPEGEVIIYTGKAVHPEEDWNEGRMPLSSIYES